ncbi:MAG: outer membrane lipoprotein-sorting protein [Pseudomonadota bacterium]
MRMYLYFFGVFMVLFATGVILARADQVVPEEIIAQTDKARGNLQGIVWIADIESQEDGKIQHRSLIIKNRGENSVAEFTAPAKVQGNKLVMLDRNMWFTKPGLSKPVPISPRQKLIGGAANGDIASTNYAADYDAVLVSEDQVEGIPCYVFDLSAKSKKTTYDRIRYWVSKERLLAEKAEFFTLSGKLFKTATFRYDNTFGNDKGGQQPFISRMTIFDEVTKGNVTIMNYHDIKLETLPDAVFNLNLL